MLSGYYAANEKERTRIGNLSIVTNGSTIYITQLDLYNKNISYQVDWLVSNLCSFTLYIIPIFPGMKPSQVGIVPNIHWDNFPVSGTGLKMQHTLGNTIF